MKIVTKLLEQANQSRSVWALWNWNSQITEEQMNKQFYQIKDAGFSGIILRPSKSISPLYLSEEFNYFFIQLLALAEKESISVMMGDDLSTPPVSPFSQTLTLQKNHRAIRLTLIDEQNLESGEQFQFTPEQGRQEYLLVSPRTSQRRISLEGTKLLYDGTEETTTKWTAPKGSWKIIRLAVVDAKTDTGELIPNFFSMKCAQSYINTVLEPLCELQGKKLSPSFKGLYCEMPPIVPSKTGIPWDEELFVSKYRSRFKRNLITTLPALFFPAHENDAKYRPHVLNFIQDTLMERFPSVCQKWATSKKLDFWFIGAESDVTDLNSSVSPLFTLANNDYNVTGLRCDTDSPISEAAVITTAALNRDLYKRSTAVVINRNNHMKSNTLAEAKYFADSAILNGADIIIIDGLYMNQEYTFSRTTPPGISFAHPDFPKMKELVSTIRNTIAATTSQMEFPSCVALLYPSQSAMADYAVADPAIIQNVTATFLKVVDQLHASQVPFTILTEQDATECKVNSDGTLIHPKSDKVISGIILPYSRLINNSLFVLLEKFAIKKGTVIFLNEAPQGSFDDGVSGTFVNRVEKLINAKSKSVYASTTAELPNYFTPEQTHVDYRITPEVDLEAIRINFSQYEDLTGVTIQNRSDELLPLALPRINHHRYYQFDPINGKICKVDSGDPQHEENFQFDVQPHETLILFSSGGTAGSIKEGLLEQELYQYRIRMRNDRWGFVANSLNNFPLTRWNTRMSIDRGTGVLSNYYETTFELATAAVESYLVFADSRAKADKSIQNRFKVLLNGQELPILDDRTPSPEDAWAYFDDDSSILLYSLEEYLERGTNTIRIMRNSTGPTPEPLLYPPIVSVKAPVEQTPKGWRIIPAPEENNFSWGGNGYPYLVGTGTYTHSFEVPQGAERIVLCFDKLSGSADIALNGESLKTLLWPPYRLDITDMVIEKRNELTVTVRNSLSAISHLNGKDSGISGDVFLEVYDPSMSNADEE